MTLENIISFAFGVVAINVKTPIDSTFISNMQTPIENMFTATDAHEIILSGIKVLTAGLISVVVNKMFHKTPKATNVATKQQHEQQ